MAHVLLIDDDLAFIPEQVRQAFPPPNHQVTWVATGAIGVERVRALLPDVVLLDLLLPDQSGLAVYEQIRAISSISTRSTRAVTSRHGNSRSCSRPSCGQHSSHY